MLVNIDNCIDCGAHIIEPDPDPTDWFCDDDVKVRCTKAHNQTPQLHSSGQTMVGEPYITVACRPYRTRHECSVPDWCPIKVK